MEAFPVTPEVSLVTPAEPFIILFELLSEDEKILLLIMSNRFFSVLIAAKIRLENNSSILLRTSNGLEKVIKKPLLSIIGIIGALTISVLKCTISF